MQLTYFIPLLLAITPEFVQSVPSYRSLFPNGKLFKMATFHAAGGENPTHFTQEFVKAGKKWTKDLCQMYEGEAWEMTFGQAFGDPCCTWVEGATPDFVVQDFGSSVPLKKWTCPEATTPPPPPTTTTQAPVTQPPPPTTTTQAPVTQPPPSSTPVVTSGPKKCEDAKV